MLSEEVYRTKKAFEGILNLNPEMVKLFQDAQSRISHFQQLNPDLVNILNKFKPLLEAIKPINEIIKPALQAHESIKKYITARVLMAKQIAIFPENGWYLSSAFTDTLDANKITVFLSQSNKQWNSDIEDMFLKAFDDDISEIRERITETFEPRANFLEHIIELHQREDYISSIPLALAQTDGMCRDNFWQEVKGIRKPLGFFKAELSNSRQKAQALSAGIVVEEESIFSFITNQLANSDRNLHPLLKAETKDLSDLNRNAILHGESLDYGSKINSVKSILLLDFVTDLVIVNRFLLSKDISNR